MKRKIAVFGAALAFAVAGLINFTTTTADGLSPCTSCQPPREDPPLPCTSCQPPREDPPSQPPRR